MQLNDMVGSDLPMQDGVLLERMDVCGVSSRGNVLDIARFLQFSKKKT